MAIAILTLLLCSATALKMNTDELSDDPQHGWAIHNLRNPSIIFYGAGEVARWETIPEFKELWKSMFIDRYGPSYVSGDEDDTISDLTWRVQNWESPKFAKPKVIMVQIGSNDIQDKLPKFATDEAEPDEIAEIIVKDQIKLVKELGHASPDSRIVISAINPRSREWGFEPSNPSYWEMVAVDVNKQLKHFADKSHGIYFADCTHTYLKANGTTIDPARSADYVHLTPEGTKAFGECLQKTLDPILLK